MVVDGDGAAAGIGGRGFEVGIKGGIGSIQIRSRSLLCCCIYQPAAVTKGKKGDVHVLDLLPYVLRYHLLRKLHVLFSPSTILYRLAILQRVVLTYPL